MRHNRSLIGVISDTHSWYDPAVEALFKGVDHILHAGDIGDMRVLYRLREIAPVTAVRGNIDEGIHATPLNLEEKVCLFGVEVFMTHILGNPERLSRELQLKVKQLTPNVVIFGHTHQSYLGNREGVLYFNPGSAGPRRFSLPRSIGLLEVTMGKVEAKIIKI
jgi:putative phosphoesterase